MLTADDHEQQGSVTINAGVADPLNGTADPDGHPRQYGTAPDIGAYEFPLARAVKLTGISALTGTG